MPCICNHEILWSLYWYNLLDGLTFVEKHLRTSSLSSVNTTSMPPVMFVSPTKWRNLQSTKNMITKHITMTSLLSRWHQSSTSMLTSHQYASQKRTTFAPMWRVRSLDGARLKLVYNSCSVFLYRVATIGWADNYIHKQTRTMEGPLGIDATKLKAYECANVDTDRHNEV